MVAFDRLTNDLGQSCLKLNGELVVTPQSYKDGFRFHIEIPSAAKFFRLGFAEYVLVSLFDGRTSFSHAFALASQKLGEDSLSEQQAKQTVYWMIENGIAQFTDDQSAIDPLRAEKKQASLLQKLNPFWLKIPLGDAHQYIGTLEPWFRKCFTASAFLFYLILTSIAGMTLLYHWDEFVESANSIFMPTNWIWLAITWVLLKVIHELAHGLACHTLGGRVRESGIIFILFAPMAYVDVTSSWRFVSRWKRIIVAVAGIFAELVVASICFLCWCFSDSPTLKMHLFNVILMASVSTILFNANPLMRFDGYYILSDLLRLPNLYENGTKAFRQLMKRIFYGETKSDACLELDRHPGLILTYGFAATIWKLVVCFGLGLAASLMFGGFGILIACLGISSWFGKPAWELIKDVKKRFYAKPETLVRGGLLTAILAVVTMASWFLIPNPLHHRTPCIVSFQDSTQVRALTAGFIREVFVADGELVEEGQPLARLDNMELAAEILQLEAKLSKQAAQERLAIDDASHAGAQVARRQQRATRKILEEKRKQQKELIVLAPVAGRVIARNISQRPGTFIERGSEFLTIGNERCKEIVLSIGEGAAVDRDQLVGSKIRIEIGSRPGFLAKIKRMDPQASHAVTHEALIAPNGGVLPVSEAGAQPESESRYELLEPRFRAIAEIESDVAGNLFSGERGYATLEKSELTLGQSLFLAASRWFERKIKEASKLARSGTTS